MVKTINECIDLIRRQNELEDLTEKDIKELLESVRPFLLKRYGKELMMQVEKLCMARNFDRAVKLLESLPSSRFLLPKGKSVIREAVIISILVGVGGLVFFLNIDESGTVQNENMEISWKTTEGIINYSRISSNPSFETGSSEYYPAIQYSFTVEGTRYAADSIVYDKSSDAMTIVENYQEGDIVDIFYNTENPEQSYLSAHAQVAGNNWFMYIIILTGIVGVFYFINRIGKKKKLIKDF